MPFTPTPRVAGMRFWNVYFATPGVPVGRLRGLSGERRNRRYGGEEPHYTVEATTEAEARMIGIDRAFQVANDQVTERGACVLRMIHDVPVIIRTDGRHMPGPED